MKKSILTAMIVLASMASCKDKEDKNTDPKPKLSARKQALIGKDWKLTAYKVNGVDMISMFPSCMRDNIVHHFTDESKGYMDEGASKCDQADSQRLSLTWKMIANETKMIINQDGSSDTLEIISVNGNELQYKVEEGEATLKY